MCVSELITNRTDDGRKVDEVVLICLDPVVIDLRQLDRQAINLKTYNGHPSAHGVRHG